MPILIQISMVIQRYEVTLFKGWFNVPVPTGLAHNFHSFICGVNLVQVIYNLEICKAHNQQVKRALIVVGTTLVNSFCFNYNRSSISHYYVGKYIGIALLLSNTHMSLFDILITDISTRLSIFLQSVNVSVTISYTPLHRIFFKTYSFDISMI